MWKRKPQEGSTECHCKEIAERHRLAVELAQYHATLPSPLEEWLQLQQPPPLPTTKPLPSTKSNRWKAIEFGYTHSFLTSWNDRATATGSVFAHSGVSEADLQRRLLKATAGVHCCHCQESLAGKKGWTFKDQEGIYRQLCDDCHDYRLIMEGK
jgi:hypothetical protein